MSKCELCGEPMPPGEEMYKYHGYSGPCPKPPTVAASPPVNASAELALLRANIGDLLDENVRLQAALSESEARAERARRALGEATELFAEVLGYFTRQVHPGESCWEAGFMYDAHRKQYYESLARLRTLAGGTESET